MLSLLVQRWNYCEPSMGFLSAALLLAVSGQQLANAKRNSGDRDAVKTDVSSMLNFNCKNASSDWPVCRPPSDGYKLRFGAGSGAGANSFPISAWWGPIGYGAGKSAGYTELDAYAKANFTMVMVSDRNNRLDAQNRTLNCDASDPSRGWQASLDYLDVQVDQVEKRGMQSIFDTYRCLPWGGAANAGGASQGGGGWVAEKHGAPHNHKVTLPEVQFLARRMRNRTSCVGLLITDDGVDLHENELAEVKWMRKVSVLLLVLLLVLLVVLTPLASHEEHAGALPVGQPMRRRQRVARARRHAVCGPGIVCRRRRHREAPQRAARGDDGAAAHPDLRFVVGRQVRPLWPRLLPVA